MNEKGQLLVGALILLVMLLIAVPAIVRYTQSESKWTTKNSQSTRAFHLAESGIENGFQVLILSTAAWSQLQSGTAQAGYNFDKVYSDTDGQYEISMTSGPSLNQVTIKSVGRDTSGSEIRAIKAIYSTSALGNSAIITIQGYSMSGNPNVEWGAVVSPTGPIVTGGQNHPQYWSNGSISPWKTTNTPPQTDNVQWWAYQNLSPAPQLDLVAYKAIAQAQGTYDNSPNCGVTLSAASSFVGYCEGNLSLGPHNFFKGALIVIGNLSLSGAFGNGTPTVSVPSAAWQQYGNDWSFYVTNFDPTCPYASYAAAKAANYAPMTLSKTISSALMDGFLYVGQTLSISGGGNNNMVGVLYAQQVANLGNSHVTFYYDNAVTQTVKTLTSTPTRSSWNDLSGCGWSGTHPTCP